MSAARVLRLGVSATTADRSEALAVRLGAVERVRVSGDADSLRAALRTGDVDVVVQSTSQLPTATADDIELVAVLKRALGEDERLPPSVWSGASAPDSIVLEMAAGADGGLRRRVAKLDHAPTAALVRAERAVLGGFASDGAPRVAVTAMREDGLFFLTATRYDADGAAVRTASHAGYPEDSADLPAELAARVVAELIAEDSIDPV